MITSHEAAEMPMKNAGAIMQSALKPPLWTKAILILPLVFSLWSVSLVVSVDRAQQDVAHSVNLINKLNELKQPLRDLKQGVTLMAQASDANSARARWAQLSENFRRHRTQVETLNNNSAELRRSLATIDEAFKAVNAAVENTSLSQAVEAEKKKVEDESQRALDGAVDETDAAVRDLRQHLSQLSTELARKWTQLNLLVIFSCLLAIGVALLFMTSQRDLSQRRLAQDELKKERDFIAAVNETMESLVIVLNREGRIVRFNRAAERMTGYTFEEVKGKFLWDQFLIAEEVPGVRQVFQELRAGHFPNEHENHLMTKDGRRRLVAWSNTALLDAAGEPEFVIGTGIDITERQRAEGALREGLNLLNAVIEGTPDTIFAKDLEGRYLTINSAGARFLGQPVEEIVGKKDAELYPPETAAQFIAHDQQVLASGQSQTFEGHATVGDASEMFLVTKAVYRNHQGEIIGLIGISHDITARKQAEEQRLEFVREQQARINAEEANRTKDEFLSTLSHELRTPLTAILGWSQLLNAGGLDAENVARGFDTIERNAKVQRQLIDDLLDISRIVTGKLSIVARPVNLSQTIEAALDGVRPAARMKDIELEADLTAATLEVDGDAVRLQQIVWNLLTNAIKFTPEGGRVRVRLEGSDETALIKIEDTGRGISADFLPHIFDRFRQADSSTTREQGGLGLGLALVRSLVELHGGAVRAESGGLKQGATFTVELPLHATQDAATGGHPSLTKESPANESLASENVANRRTAHDGDNIEDLRVLVVDDDADACQLIGMALRTRGAEVQLANSAAEAFALFTSWRPDLLVSDIGMPDEDGYQLIRKIRALPPEHGGSTPALALTAYARDEDRAHALAAGFQKHIVKPVEVKALAEAVANLAEEKQSGRMKAEG